MTMDDGGVCVLFLVLGRGRGRGRGVVGVVFVVVVVVLRWHEAVMRNGINRALSFGALRK
jgi:hypothetical protein